MTLNKKIEALKYFQPPFHYEPVGQTIYCHSNNGANMALQVRGWGNLIGVSANGLDHEKAAQIQDEFGQWVANSMNASLPEPMSEDAIGEIIANTIMLVSVENSRDMAKAVIEQLKSAGCLLVRES